MPLDLLNELTGHHAGKTTLNSRLSGLTAASWAAVDDVDVDIGADGDETEAERSQAMVSSSAQDAKNRGYRVPIGFAGSRISEGEAG